MKLILASTAKNKSDILNTVMIKHECKGSDFNERAVECKNVYDYVKELSLGKAKDVANKVSNSVILGLDTVCVIGGEVVLKPKSVEDVKNSIRKSSGSTNKVITGIALIDQTTGKTINTYSETKVTFKHIDEDMIDYYAKHEPNAMYASGFIVETFLSNFIDKIEGSYYNILGVPCEKIFDGLKELGYNIFDINGRD